MALAVCLLFDARSDLRVRELWSRLEAAGVASLATHTHRRHHPHLSYAVLRTWDHERVHEALGGLPRADIGADACAMTVHGALMFPRGRVGLAVATPADMGLRQAETVAALAATGAELHRHYRSGRWVPHVSVSPHTHRSDVPTVVRMICDILPLTIRVDRAALVDSSTGQTWPLPHIL